MKARGIKNTELGEFPEDWDVRTYGEIFGSHSTASNSRSDLSEVGEISYVHYGDIHTKFDTRLNFDLAALPKIERSKFKAATYLKDGDVIMADASEDYEGIGKSVEVANLGDGKDRWLTHLPATRHTARIYVDGFRGYLHSIAAVKNLLISSRRD